MRFKELNENYSDTIYYHGAKNFEGDIFDHKRTGGIGFHFTPDIEQAKTFGDQIISARLRLDNPAPLEIWKHAMNKAHGGNPRKMAIDYLRSLGYDCVINPAYETIVFEPEQIQIINLNEGWKDTLKRSVIPLGLAMGAATVGSDYAVSNIQEPETHTMQYQSGIKDFDYQNFDRLDKSNKTYPKELEGKQGEELKQAFVNHMLPLIKKNNDKIQHERTKLLSKKYNQEWLDSMFEKYKVPDKNINELIKRVDIIPVPMVMAQSALESGWGTSRFAKEGNALFGQKTTAKTDLASQTDKYAGFKSFDESIEAYMKNLNTHDAYEHFRETRFNMRKENKDLNAKSLMNTLLKYSTRGKAYVSHIKQIMASNKLDKLG